MAENGTPKTFDPYKADAQYKTFPNFDSWAKCVVYESRWTKYSDKLSKSSAPPPGLLKQALDIVKRAAAVDTGAIEGLYETDRGFTFTVATETALWQAAVDKKGEKVRNLIQTQIAAYDYVIDFATRKEPLVEAWIRELHKQICVAQETYQAFTEIGIQDLPLPKGEYKHLPNHVMRKDGSIHAHSPVDLTSAEMNKLCKEMQSEQFLQSHPVLQASYAHYAFVTIHPFADGNGRVARALASVFTYRSNSVPLLILSESRGEYLSTLEAADAGSFQPFVSFVEERGLDAMKLAADSLRAAHYPTSDESINKISSLYVTTGGYTHEQVDGIGFRLFEVFHNQLNTESAKIKANPQISVTSSLGGNLQAVDRRSGYRLPISSKGTPSVTLSLSTHVPAQAQVNLHCQLELPKDCGKDDDIVIKNTRTGESYEFRVSEIVPNPTAALQMRISVIIEGVIRELLNQLSQLAAQKLGNQ